MIKLSAKIFQLTQQKQSNFLEVFFVADDFEEMNMKTAKTAEIIVVSVK